MKKRLPKIWVVTTVVLSTGVYATTGVHGRTGIPGAPGAQGTSEPEICTDRPTVTPSPFVVPPNYVQAENGLALRKENRGNTFNVPQTQIRLGVLPRAELRLTVPNYFLTGRTTEPASGVADMAIGSKIQLGPLPGRIDLAVIPGFTVPTGSRYLTTNSVDPFVQIIAGRRLSNNWTVESAQSMFFSSEAAEPQAQGLRTNQQNRGTLEHNIIYQPTCVIFRKLTPRADCFLEYAGNFTKHKVSSQFIDSGAVFRFKRNQQLDFRGGVGFTKNSPTVFIEFGYSVLLGKIIR